MNTTFKMLVDLLLNDVVTNPNAVHTEAAKRYVNQSYMTVCASKKIEALSITEVLSVNVDGECVIPSDCAPDNIESLVDSDGIQYFRDESRGRGNANYAKNYYFDGMMPALATSDTGGIASGDVTLTVGEDIFTADMVGQSISIGSGAGIYRIATFSDAKTVTIDDTFRGDTVSNGHVSVRPEPTYIIKFVDDRGIQLSPTSVTLRYQRIPLPLYNDYDVLLIPGTCEDVRTMALQSMLRRLGKGREARMMSDEVRIERALAAKDNSQKRYPFRPRGMFRRVDSKRINRGSGSAEPTVGGWVNGDY